MLKKRKNNRTKQQGAETRKLLYACAEKLFQEYDYQNVSVESITRMARVTKCTFMCILNSRKILIFLKEKPDGHYSAHPVFMVELRGFEPLTF